MIDESVLFVHPSHDVVAVARLLFAPTKILSVRNASQTEVYEDGRDYLWNPGTRTLTATLNSRISTITDAGLHPPRGSQKYGTCRDRECDLLFNEDGEFHRRQVLVTYEHQLDEWELLHPPTAALPRLARRLANRENIVVALLGDSISVGLNASACDKIAPFQPGYGELFAEFLRQKYQVQVEFSNHSVGGKNAVWGIEQVPAVAAQKPDLVLLAFGMNDATDRFKSSQFAEHIAAQVSGIRTLHPDTEFVLVSTMSGNPEWTGTRMDLYPEYRGSLMGLETDGVVVADATSVWMQLVARKKFVDLTGNGLNHPNDFGHRVYAQVIGATLATAAAVRQDSQKLASEIC
jgi:lysophospholipase L1-like esterase